MEGQPTQGGAADLPGIGQHLAHIETAICQFRDHVAGDGTVDLGQLVAGRHPTSANEAFKSHGAPWNDPGSRVGSAASAPHH